MTRGAATRSIPTTIGNLLGKAGVVYGCNDGAHKHAVTHLVRAQKYWYDANGNMVTRVEDG